jgi:transcriptional regulator with XRE-family HTH domain
VTRFTDSTIHGPAGESGVDPTVFPGTPADDESLAQLRRAVGDRLRAARAAKGLSLRALAKKSDLTSGFISQIENGRVMPSIAALIRLCAALDIEVGAILSDALPRGRVVRHADRAVYLFPEAGYHDEIVSSDSTKRLEVMRSVIEPGGSTGPEPYTHGSDVEVALVLKGRIIVDLGDERYELRPGDALTFQGTLPHTVTNPGKTEAEIVWSLTPARY